MNDPVYQELRELSWRRELTAAEQERLQTLLADPVAREHWEAEVSLNHLLEELPAAPPVSSNFTALVMQAVEREAAASVRAAGKRRAWWPALPRWISRAAVATVVLGLGVGIFVQQEAEHNRRVMARSFKEVSAVVAASTPAVMENPEVVENFDAIRMMGSLQPKGDPDLLALME